MMADETTRHALHALEAGRGDETLFCLLGVCAAGNSDRYL